MPHWNETVSVEVATGSQCWFTAPGNLTLPLPQADWRVETMRVHAGAWWVGSLVLKFQFASEEDLGQCKWKCCVKVIKPCSRSGFMIHASTLKHTWHAHTHRRRRCFLRNKWEGTSILWLICCFWPSSGPCDLLHESGQCSCHASVLPSSRWLPPSVFVPRKTSSGGLHMIWTLFRYRRKFCFLFSISDVAKVNIILIIITIIIILLLLFLLEVLKGFLFFLFFFCFSVHKLKKVGPHPRVHPL